jgi:hypothetical protein
MTEETITIPLKDYNLLLKQLRLLQDEVKKLREDIQLLKNGKQSTTSSTPPSHDIGRSNAKSLRIPSGKKPGGQFGHKGSTLQMTESPDKIVDYLPSYCKYCGELLDPESAIFVSRKQEIDIPPIIPEYIEHRSYSCTCGHCGVKTTSELPEYLKANIQYSSHIKSLVGYLSVRQYVPYKRIVELMKSCFNISLSQGTIENMLIDLSEKATPLYDEIKRLVGLSSVVGGDESGIKINGKLNWLFTFQTELLTYLHASKSRGYQTIENLFKDGFPVSVYVTDCLAAQLKVNARAHQICTAHLIRELTNFIEATGCEWSEKMKRLILNSLEIKSRLEDKDYEYPSIEVLQKEEELTELLEVDFSKKHKKIQAFIKRLNKNRNSILTFLYHPDVPPDNNASERSIRNAKVKMKVSTQFKSDMGAKCYAKLRSVIDTAIKKSLNILEILTMVANLTTPAV